MKLKFLDARNCHALLPPSNGLPMIRQLDKCLNGINNEKGKLHGSIDALIEQNKKTINRAHGMKRLISSPIEIAQLSNVPTKEIRTNAIIRVWPFPAVLHTLQRYENNVTWKTIVPLQFLLKNWGNASEGHQCYIHTITQNTDKKTGFTPWHELQDGNSDNYSYVGITGRNWLLRLREHIGEIRRGSRKKFHKAWRESLGLTNVLFTSHLWEVNLSFEDAMNWEEKTVEKVANGPNGLNMIPGGFKGLRMLHKLRITDRINVNLEEREKAIAEYARQNPRKGIPNPFIAELWKDDEYYHKVIEAREKTLSKDQVRMIRELNELGRSLAEITKEVGALDEAQVKRVIEGKTYTRYN
jgi:hypothetical protein